MFTLDDAIRAAIAISNDEDSCPWGEPFDPQPYELPRWAIDELDASGDAHDGELALRYRGALAASATIPNWTRTAPTKALLEAIGDIRLRQGVAASLEHRTNVLLQGATGVGKTAALGWAVREMGFQQLAGDYITRLRRFVEGKREACFERHPEEGVRSIRRMEFVAAQRITWCTAYQLAEAFRQHPLGVGEPPLVIDMRTKACAFLDDLGNESRGSEALFSVMDSRYEQGLRTFVSTGLTTDELNSRYGMAFVRRLTEYRGKGSVVVDLFDERRVRAVR